MASMRFIENLQDFGEFYEVLTSRAVLADSTVSNDVLKILNDVREGGDAALKKYTKMFDGHEPEELGIKKDNVASCAKKIEKKFIDALFVASVRIREFHERQKEESWSYEKDGVLLGQMIRPIERVGLYVPGGKAGYPSTVLMSAIPAMVAGVKEIVVVTPSPEGQLNPYTMAAIDLLGIEEVYCVGGAQAVGALSYGTESIKKVDKIVGPGNIYVATAKRFVFGSVDIDMVAGPSEILVIADDSANPRFVALDLLSQAEHDEMASSILITTSREVAEGVRMALDKELRSLQRSEIARKSLASYGAIVIVDTIEDAFKLSNKIAPEHLEIVLKSANGHPESANGYSESANGYSESAYDHVKLVENAGAVFLGDWSTEPMGDYLAGPNHTLPTSGTSRFFSPLGVYDFYKRSSLIRFSKDAFIRLSPTVLDLAEMEGLYAHGEAVRVRQEFIKKAAHKIY